jgi:hypothetical protein
MSPISRRDAISSTLAMVGAAAAFPSLPAPAMSHELLSDLPRTGDKHDWDWLAGSWNVRHWRLRERLLNDNRWDEFRGTCRMWTTMEGEGNVDDNYLELPSGAYRAMGVRALDRTSGLWSIWWLDARYNKVDPPVRGGFKDGIGTFIGEDSLRDKPILMRFEWSKIQKNSAHWEQAFSPDKGQTWEVNWRMDFTRAPHD